MALVAGLRSDGPPRDFVRGGFASVGTAVCETQAGPVLAWLSCNVYYCRGVRVTRGAGGRCTEGVRLYASRGLQGGKQAAVR